MSALPRAIDAAARAIRVNDGAHTTGAATLAEHVIAALMADPDLLVGLAIEAGWLAEDVAMWLPDDWSDEGDGRSGVYYEDDAPEHAQPLYRRRIVLGWMVVSGPDRWWCDNEESARELAARMTTTHPHNPHGFAVCGVVTIEQDPWWAPLMRHPWEKAEDEDRGSTWGHDGWWGHEGFAGL